MKVFPTVWKHGRVDLSCWLIIIRFDCFTVCRWAKTFSLNPLCFIQSFQTCQNVERDVVDYWFFSFSCSVLDKHTERMGGKYHFNESMSSRNMSLNVWRSPWQNHDRTYWCNVLLSSCMFWLVWHLLLYNKEKLAESFTVRVRVSFLLVRTRTSLILPAGK